MHRDFCCGFLVSVIILVLLPAPALAQSWDDLCKASKGEASSTSYGPFRIEVKDFDPGGGFECVRVLSPSGEVLAEDAGRPPAMQQIDLDGDGVRELLVVVDAGGSSGFNNAFVFSETPQPRLAGVIENACAPTVQRETHLPGPMLGTCDLAFSRFEGLCNACSPRASVYLGLEKGLLRDRSALFVDNYDAEIAELRKELSDQDLQAFLTSQNADEGAYFDADARGIVLGIVIAYVYSGRAQQARDVLEKMWPAWDRARVWDSIQETRSEGLLFR